MRAEHLVRAARGERSKPRSDEHPGDGNNGLLILVADGDEDGALVGSTVPAAIWLLAKASGKVVVDSHHLAGAAHLRAEDHIDAGELAEREDRLPSPRCASGRAAPSRPSSASDLPAITFAAIFAHGTPVALETNGTVRLARGFTSIT